MYILFVTLLLSLGSGFINCDRSTEYIKAFAQSQYRAAVYEHAVTTPIKMATNHQEAVKQMNVNLREYEKQAAYASQQNVDILVFPEDGIYGFISERDDMKHYIEDIPDPVTSSWTPCDEQTRFPQALDVVIFLSCLAKNSSLYLVANYGDAKACLKADPNCPEGGQYQYNTDLAFDPSGKFIAKYHKQNLYYENQFDEPITPEYTYFDTEFGRFGMFTCFDILFHEPMIPLIEKYNITDVVFPTAWRDVLPYYSAIGYHSSVAAAYKLNVLAANIHLPLFRFQGSGIYTPYGANVFYYDNRYFSSGKLLISDVDIVAFSPKTRNYSLKQAVVTKFLEKSDDIIHRTDQIHAKHPKENPILPKNYRSENVVDSEIEKAVVFKDWYNIVVLNETTGQLEVCQRGFCCHLQYEAFELNDMYAFGVFNGRHTEEGTYYIQVCLLMVCTTRDVSSCGQSTFTSNTIFDSICMSGTFETTYVTPQVLLSEGESLKLPRKGTMEYRNGEMLVKDGSYPVIEACLFGRIYDRD